MKQLFPHNAMQCNKNINLAFVVMSNSSQIKLIRLEKFYKQYLPIIIFYGTTGEKKEKNQESQDNK
ncbi:hypothetical protein T01_3687 [Trichinella spiralis]|uniref:Uncharacterized protein n=1 Tax=Trichinella spiralis TaxID=6334 RepID=A0A0V1BWW8_TRISP|nr:hypothetical protein T01_3687 [Trichinella spiralis]